MRLVIDANILVAELIRQRGRELILHSIWELYIPEKQWEEGSIDSALDDNFSDKM